MPNNAYGIAERTRDQLTEEVAGHLRARPPGALVIGGALGALGLVRSLGRRGIPTLLIPAGYWLARSSRYVRGSLPQAPQESEFEPANHLLQLAEDRKLHGWALFPCIDSAVEMISRNHERLARTFRLTTAPWSVVQWAHDKRFTYKRAAQIGLDHPYTYCADNIDDVAALDCRYPVILKPASRESRNAFTLDKAWKVENREALLARYAEACGLMNRAKVVIQEFIPGGGEAQYSYAGVWDGGRAVASLVARRVRQYPIDFGHTSTYVETVDEPVIEEISTRFLSSIQYSGLVEIEFKRDARDGRYKLLDVNPRLWTWHAIGISAGVDFPYVMWQLLCGAKPPVTHGKARRVWVHMSKDLLAGFQEIYRGRLSIPQYLRSLLRPLEFAVVAFDDPVPLLCDFPLSVRGALKRYIHRDQNV